jgi:hypothetical protein
VRAERAKRQRQVVELCHAQAAQTQSRPSQGGPQASPHLGQEEVDSAARNM